MALFDDGELQQETRENLEETSELFDPEENDEEAGGEVEEAEEGQENQEESTLYAGQYKTFGGMAQAYIRQRRQLGLPEDLQNYATPESLEKAFLRDKARMESKSKGKAVEEETTDESLDEMDDVQLMQEFQRQQMALNTTLSQQQPGQVSGQIPGQQMPGQQIPGQVLPMQQQAVQGYQGYNQPQAVSARHSVFDNPNLSADDFAEKLMADPVGVLRDVIREEMNIQGNQLGSALQGILTPVVQSQIQLRTAAEQDREMRKLEKQLNKRGESLDEYLPEIQQVMQQYPQLANVKDGYAQALGMARVTKAMNTRRQPVSKAKAGLRVGASQGAGVPKGQYGQGHKLTPEEAERRSIFGDLNKKRGMLDE